MITINLTNLKKWNQYLTKKIYQSPILSQFSQIVKINKLFFF